MAAMTDDATPDEARRLLLEHADLSLTCRV